MSRCAGGVLRLRVEPEVRAKVGIGTERRPQTTTTRIRAHRASGHRTGSRERADKAEIRRSIRLQLAIVAFAIIIMMFVLLGTIINNQGGTVDTPIFPWEWGSSDN